MATYPQGTPSSGIYDVFTGNSFTPNDVVRGIRDNHSPVNRTTMLVSLGYQVSLIQNFVNARYLAREEYPIDEGYITSGYFDNVYCLSGALSSDFKFTRANWDQLEAHKNQASVCGKTLVTPYEINLTRYGPDTDAWTSYWGQSGLFFEHSASDRAGTPYRIKANKVHKFRITNLSTTEDALGYSGILSLEGNYIEVKSTSDTMSLIPSTPYSDPFWLYFCGASLRVSGFGPVFMYNDIHPGVTGVIDLGRESPTRLQFHRAYIQTLNTYSETRNHGLGGSSDLVYETTLGGACGRTFTTEGLYGLKVKSDYTAGGVYQHNESRFAPNRVYLRRYQNGATPMSGYFQVNTNGQLEFFKVGVSGWVLTNF